MIHSILFTGHMIDKPERKEPRFPAHKEQAARRAIKEKLSEVIKNQSSGYLGIAGGACGGDILFHELCIEMKLSSEIYLALPVEEFKRASVSFADKDWENRFDNLISRLPVHFLDPESYRDKSENIWASANLWMLDAAQKHGGQHMTLIALWDGKGGDDIGGTEHMSTMAESMGGERKIIDIKKL